MLYFPALTCPLDLGGFSSAFFERLTRPFADAQVTIIHGETGCGKSSTVPLMLLRSHDEQAAAEGGGQGALARMFVTQPRRIAARALCERVRTTVRAQPKPQADLAGSEALDPGQLIGLRLGHGERDDDTHTRIW